MRHRSLCVWPFSKAWHIWLRTPLLWYAYYTLTSYCIIVTDDVDSHCSLDCCHTFKIAFTILPKRCARPYLICYLLLRVCATSRFDTYCQLMYHVSRPCWCFQFWDIVPTDHLLARMEIEKQGGISNFCCNLQI